MAVKRAKTFDQMYSGDLVMEDSGSPSADAEQCWPNQEDQGGPMLCHLHLATPPVSQELSL